jgi:hypothetical protein
MKLEVTGSKALLASVRERTQGSVKVRGSEVYAPPAMRPLTRLARLATLSPRERAASITPTRTRNGTLSRGRGCPTKEGR